MICSHGLQIIILITDWTSIVPKFAFLRTANSAGYYYKRVPLLQSGGQCRFELFGLRTIRPTLPKSAHEKLHAAKVGIPHGDKVRQIVNDILSNKKVGQ